MYSSKSSSLFNSKDVEQNTTVFDVILIKMTKNSSEFQETKQLKYKKSLYWMGLPGCVRLGWRGRDIQVLEGGAITLGGCADGACGRG